MNPEPYSERRKVGSWGTGAVGPQPDLPTLRFCYRRLPHSRQDHNALKDLPTLVVCKLFHPNQLPPPTLSGSILGPLQKAKTLEMLPSHHTVPQAFGNWTGLVLAS